MLIRGEKDDRYKLNYSFVLCIFILIMSLYSLENVVPPLTSSMIWSKSFNFSGVQFSCSYKTDGTSITSQGCCEGSVS